MILNYWLIESANNVVGVTACPRDHDFTASSFLCESLNFMIP